MARRFQKLVNDSVGKEFFAYLVYIAIAALLTTLLYILICKSRVKSISQYVYIILCTGLYVIFTVQLEANPEEAIHLIEYGLLSFFVYRALSFRIKDWTIYITAAFIVTLLGTADEFLQWMMPGRYWDYRDVGINALAGSLLLIIIWKGIKPAVISGPVRSCSVRILVVAITLNLVFIGFCLSNTPDNVKRYTSAFAFLSWLSQEEPMTEYGHDNYDPHIGHVYSRFTLKDLTQIDADNGKQYGKLLYDDIHAGLSADDMLKKYSADTNPFLYELLLHHFRIAFYIKEFLASSNLKDKSDFAEIALHEIPIINKYFAITFYNSGLKWLTFDRDNLKAAVLPDNETYYSKTGKMITGFDLDTARATILALLFIVWTGGEIWKRKLTPPEK